MASTHIDKPISLVFFGAGPLAAESLKFIHQHFTIEAVFTKPRPDHHKGPVPVIDFCESEGLSYHTPGSKNELSSVFSTTDLASKVGVVIDYGIIIEKSVIENFELGIINSHFSLLPEWRGADPITFSLLSGQPETGVSLMQINEKMDEGPLLAQAKLAIEPTTDGITLTEGLIELSNALLLEILPLYCDGHIQLVPQTSTIGTTTSPSYSSKLTKQDGVIDWQKPATQLEREIRAFIEWPKSKTTLGDIAVIITKAHCVEQAVTNEQRPGQIHIKDGQLIITTGDASLQIDALKPAGKKEMTTAEFIRGYQSRIVSN